MVHRDLAARNVLITKTKMCKISDFGLTRDIYVDDAYKKKSKDRGKYKLLDDQFTSVLTCSNRNLQFQSR